MIECIDVILTECNLSLYEITSIFQSAVIYMCCWIIEFKICIFWQNFFVNNDCFEHKRYFLSTYFLLYPFVLLLLYSSGIDLSIVICIPSSFCPTLGYHQRWNYYKSDVTFIFAYYFYE